MPCYRSLKEEKVSINIPIEGFSTAYKCNVCPCVKMMPSGGAQAYCWLLERICVHFVEEGRAWKAFYLFVSFPPSLVRLLEERGLTFVICGPMNLSFCSPIKRCIQTPTFLKDFIEQFQKVVTTSSELINGSCVSLFISQ